MSFKNVVQLCFVKIMSFIINFKQVNVISFKQVNVISFKQVNFISFENQIQDFKNQIGLAKIMSVENGFKNLVKG